jgi:uncharacterized LabA/DUF88 family protein
MDRVAVFVDAGYVYAGGSTAISGSSKKRTELSLNVPAVVAYFSKRAEEISGMKLLRIYWYDGAVSARLSTDQQLLASSDNVKLRLGIVNSYGEQKGVDAKIITDMADLARNKAISEAIVVGGDEDLRVGVELAQQHGARVHLLTIEGSTSSATLRQEADTQATIARDEIRAFLSVIAVPVQQTGRAAVAPAPAAPSTTPVATTVPAPTVSGGPLSKTAPAVAVTAPTTVAGPSILEEEVTTYLASLSPAERAALKSAVQVGTLIPPEHDRKLLVQGYKRLGRPLDTLEKNKLRHSLRHQLGL